MLRSALLAAFHSAHRRFDRAVERFKFILFVKSSCGWGRFTGSSHAEIILDELQVLPSQTIGRIERYGLFALSHCQLVITKPHGGHTDVVVSTRVSWRKDCRLAEETKGVLKAAGFRFRNATRSKIISSGGRYCEDCVPHHEKTLRASARATRVGRLSAFTPLFADIKRECALQTNQRPNTNHTVLMCALTVLSTQPSQNQLSAAEFLPCPHEYS